jgi:hypothetical protein
MSVYVLGAGASVSAGYPLASRLLEALSTWLDGCDRAEHWVAGVRNRILQIRETFGSLEGFESILGKLEEYGLKRFKPIGATSYHQDCKDILHDCSEQFHGFENADPVVYAGFYPQYLRSDLISAFREYFYEIEQKRTGWNAYDAFAERKAGADSSIITFNYDVALERSLATAGKWDVGNGYGYQFFLDRPTATMLPVYKLHGSVNWFKHPINDVPPPLMFPRDLALLGCDGIKDPRLGVNGTGIDNSGTFILPDPSKKFYWKSFWQPLWNAAAERLRAANEVFIHGYSMPPADMRARKLLFENIDKAAKISVHCRSTSDRIAEEFRSRGFTNLSSFPTIGFEDWTAS